MFIILPQKYHYKPQRKKPFNIMSLFSDIVLFDNSYSWARGKSIKYNIDVVTATDELVQDLDDVTRGGSWERVSEETFVTRF